MFATLNDSGDLTTLGHFIMADLLKSKDLENSSLTGLEQPIFVLLNPKNLPLLMHASIQQSLSTFGIVLITGESSSVPILVEDRNVYILGGSGNTYLSNENGRSTIAQIALAIQHYNQSNADSYFINIVEDFDKVDTQHQNLDAFIELECVLKSIASMTKNDRLTYTELSALDIIDAPYLSKNDSFYQNGSAKIYKKAYELLFGLDRTQLFLVDYFDKRRRELKLMLEARGKLIQEPDLQALVAQYSGFNLYKACARTYPSDLLDLNPKQDEKADLQVEDDYSFIAQLRLTPYETAGATPFNLEPRYTMIDLVRYCHQKTLLEESHSESKTASELGILNPLGIHLMHEYYAKGISKKTQKPKMEYPFFNVLEIKDIPTVMQAALDANLGTYGMVVVTGGSHSTAVLVSDNNCYIFEALGTDPNFCNGWGLNCITQIAIGLSALNPENPPTLHAYKQARQYDYTSCGADAYMSLKEAMRIVSKLKEVDAEAITLELSTANIADKFKNQHRDPFFQEKRVTLVLHNNTPAEITKYCQNTNKLAILPPEIREDKILKTTTGSTETITEYYQRHFKTETAFNGITGLERTLNINNASPARRLKHRDWLLARVGSLTEEILFGIIRKSSGLDLVKSQLPSSGPVHEKEMAYVKGEIHNNRFLWNNIFLRFNENPTSFSEVVGELKKGSTPKLDSI